ncbi:MAG: hypothetical protein ACAI34_25330 [Verrucomicrobium sp.]
MSDSIPPPLPPALGGPPGFMRPRWLVWVLVSVILPAIPWCFAKIVDDGTFVAVYLSVAVLFQIAASVWLSLGLARGRGQGAGAVVGFSVVFTIASLAIGSAVFFVACVAFMSA